MARPEKRHWILLRGLVRGSGHWADFPAHFKKKFPNDELELLDLPGNGELFKQTSPTKISDYVDLVRKQSSAIAQGHKVNILALSLGAMVAVDWLRQFPEDVEKAYLVVTSDSQTSRFYERLRPANYLKILSLAKAQNVREREEQLLKLLANDKSRRKEVLESLASYSASHPVDLKNFVRQLYAASQFRFPAKAPPQTELIGAWGDQFVHPTCTIRIAKKWGLSARMHPWAGHDIPIDDPAWLLEQLI